MSKIILLCVLSLLFSGCVSHHAYFQTLEQLIVGGECDEAMRYIAQQDEIPFDRQILHRGFVHEGCYKDMKKSVDYYTLAARYDNKNAINLLVSRGLSVPTADLVNTSSSRGEVGWIDIFGAAANNTLNRK